MVRRELGIRRPQAAPGLGALLRDTSEEMRSAVLAANEAYAKLGVRYALCGGLAAGAQGEPRFTKDIDFLIGDEAFVRSGSIVSFAKPMPLQAGNVAIDPIPLPENAVRKAVLDAALDARIVDVETGVPILQATWLAYMKLASPRAKDKMDVVALLRAGAVDQSALEAAIVDDPELDERYRAALTEANADTE